LRRNGQAVTNKMRREKGGKETDGLLFDNKKKGREDKGLQVQSEMQGAPCGRWAREGQEIVFPWKSQFAGARKEKQREDGDSEGGKWSVRKRKGKVTPWSGKNL